MIRIAVKPARDQFSALLRRCQRHRERIVITRGSTPCAVLVPVDFVVKSERER